MARDFKTIGVVGLGTMGAGITEVFARNGYSVVGVEIDETGAAKLLVTSRALRLRRDHPQLFSRYAPLPAHGSAAEHVVAFDRGDAVTVATRLPVGLNLQGGWGDTTIQIAGRPVVEAQQPLERAADRGNVRVDLLGSEQLAGFVLPRRVPDLGGAAAHEHDRTVPRLLQSPQQHDLHQASDMQAGRGRVEPDIGGDDFFTRERVQCGAVGRLVNVAALVEQLE